MDSSVNPLAAPYRCGRALGEFCATLEHVLRHAHLCAAASFDDTAGILKHIRADSAPIASGAPISLSGGTMRSL